MGLRGPQPKGKVKIEWSADFAYAVGLIATDGCLYNHKYINFTSKDIEQINNFQKALGINIHVGIKGSGSSEGKKYHTIQFLDENFYDFLNSIGIYPAKSKTMAEIAIPDEFFFDFLRGSFDGDGSVYSYWDLRWKSSFMFYISLVSASQRHILWLQSKIKEKIGIAGHITKAKKDPCYQLKYAKSESLILIRNLYHSPGILHLSRKKLKIDQMLAIVQSNAQVAKLIDA